MDSGSAYKAEGFFKFVHYVRVCETNQDAPAVCLERPSALLKGTAGLRYMLMWRCTHHDHDAERPFDVRSDLVTSVRDKANHAPKPSDLCSHWANHHRNPEDQDSDLHDYVHKQLAR